MVGSEESISQIDSLSEIESNRFSNFRNAISGLIPRTSIMLEMLGINSFRIDNFHEKKERAGQPKSLPVTIFQLNLTRF